MTEIDPSNGRLDAIFRIVLAIVFTVTIWPFVVAVGLIGGLVFAVVDLVLQLIYGGRGATGGGIVTGWGQRLFWWPIDQLTYIIGVSDKGFPVLP